MKATLQLIIVLSLSYAAPSLKADFMVINESQHTLKVKRGTDRETDLRKGSSKTFTSQKTSDEVKIRGPLQLDATIRVPKGHKVRVMRRGLRWEIKIGRR